MSIHEKQLEQFKNKAGFIAALDQSGGSTPKALRLYGVNENAWSGEGDMYTLVHQMRTRIISSPQFTGERILGSILFENTMERDIGGMASADYLWNVKQVAPILKIDKGLAEEQDGSQVMKPMPTLDALLEKAKSKGIFGTKMRSVIKQADPAGVTAVAKQQFEIGRRILNSGLVPILEPEIDIHCPNKAKAEMLLKTEILNGLDQLGEGQLVMFKLTLPEEDNFYLDCIDHPNVLRVVALSGGYSREEANARLARQNRMIASFSRALTEGLTAQQSDEEFNAMLGSSIESIYQASKN